MSTTDYDPSEHTNQEVLDHLASADPDELQRVLELEAAPEGRQRVGILRTLDAEQGELVTVQLRHHWTDAAGVAHAPGAELDVPKAVGEQLVAARYASSADTSEGDSA